MKTIITHINEVVNQDKILSFDIDVEPVCFSSLNEKVLRIVILFGTGEKDYTTLLSILLREEYNEGLLINKVADLLAMELVKSNVVRASLLETEIRELLKEMQE